MREDQRLFVPAWRLHDVCDLVKSGVRAIDSRSGDPIFVQSLPRHSFWRINVDSCDFRPGSPDQCSYLLSFCFSEVSGSVDDGFRCLPSNLE
jgi:hypothetical protein